MRRNVWLSVFVAALVVLASADWAVAADMRTRSMFGQFIWPGGGWIGVLLLCIDVASIAIIIEYFINIRRTNVLPDPVREQIGALLEEKEYRGVIELTASEPSFLSSVVNAALSEAAHGYSAMQRGMEEAIEERTTRLLRKIEVLNIIGSIAPMLGLMGTVLGMILAFNKIVEAGGVPDPAQLADSIGIALVTTFWGLVVAVPALSVYAFMRNRIDALSAETSLTAQELISAFRPGGRKDGGA